METIRYQILDEAIVKQVLEVFVKTFNSDPWNEHWTNKTAYKRLYPLVTNKQGLGIACYYNDVICGFILGIEEQDYNGLAFTIREFCIDESLQGKSIGTHLYQELEKELVKREIVSINLLTLRGELPEQFYQKQGFKNSNRTLYMDKEIL